MKVAFYKNGGRILDKVIRFWEIGPYSHCELVLSDKPTSTGYYQVASSLLGVGVRTTWRLLPDSDWDFVDVPADVEKAKAWFKEHDGAGYDYVGNLGFIFRPIRSENGRRYFCSEAIGLALGLGEAWRFDPNALYSVLKYKAG